LRIITYPPLLLQVDLSDEEGDPDEDLESGVVGPAAGGAKDGAKEGGAAGGGGGAGNDGTMGRSNKARAGGSGELGVNKKGTPLYSR
jgi:hypothetical protein